MVLCFEVRLICLGGFINLVLSFLVESDGDSMFLFNGFKFSACKFSYLRCLKSLKCWIFGLWIKMFLSQVLGFGASVTLSFLLSIFSPLFIEMFSLFSLYTLEGLIYDLEINDMIVYIFILKCIFNQ